MSKVMIVEAFLPGVSTTFLRLAGFRRLEIAVEDVRSGGWGRRRHLPLLALLLLAACLVSGVAHADFDEAGGKADPPASSEVTQEGAEVLVVAGETQYDTSAEQALMAFPEGASRAIVASGDIPVDALAATSLAGALECPILLTAKAELPSSVSLALKTLGVEEVVVVGGPAVVSSSVERALGNKGLSVERLYGDSQFDTQMAIYDYGEERGLWDGSDTLIVASGLAVSAADALSASPIAYRLKAPVILADSEGSIPGVTAAAFAAQSRYTRVLLIGGRAVVSDVSYGYMAALTMLNTGEENVIRLAGETLYDTSAAVAQWAVDQGILGWDGLAFSTGRTPFDSIGGSVVQGAFGSVLLLIDPGHTACLDAAARFEGPVSSLVFFGGEAVMPTSLRDSICEVLVPPAPSDEDEEDGEDEDAEAGDSDSDQGASGGSESTEDPAGGAAAGGSSSAGATDEGSGSQSAAGGGASSGPSASSDVSDDSESAEGGVEDGE